MKLKTVKRDAELVQSYQSGNKAAWDTLCSECGRRLAQFFYNGGIGNPEDVADLVQDTLLAAMENIRTIRKPERFNSWLFTIANRKKAGWFENQKKRESYEPAGGVSEDEFVETDVKSASAYLEPERITIHNEYMEIVRRLMEQFPQTQKDAILLRATGMPYKEIAKQLKIKEGNVKVQLNRGRKELKALLKAKYPDDYTDMVGSEIIQSLLGKQT